MPSRKAYRHALDQLVKAVDFRFRGTFDYNVPDFQKDLERARKLAAEPTGDGKVAPINVNIIEAKDDNVFLDGVIEFSENPPANVDEDAVQRFGVFAFGRLEDLMKSSPDVAKRVKIVRAAELVLRNLFKMDDEKFPPNFFAYGTDAAAVYAYPYDTAEGFPFEADSWFFQTGNRWMAVVARWELDWFNESDEEGTNYPDVRAYSIDHVPPYGTLIYRRADGTEVEEPAPDACPVCSGPLVMSDPSDGNPEVIYCLNSSGDHFRTDTGVTPHELELRRYRAANDSGRMDIIAEILGKNKEWSGDELDAIANVIRESGRTYREQG